MKIVSISWVRNEADVVEAFVRHHWPLMTRMIIVDNRSTDNTAMILQRLQEEGLPIEVRRDVSFIHRQGEAMTEILETLRNESVDWVVPLDADEFLITSDPAGLRSALVDLPTDRPIHIPWRSYVPLPSDPPDEVNVLRRITHRKQRENPQWYKVMIPAPVLAQHVSLPLGSHCLFGSDGITPVPYHLSTDVSLAHFPVRSPEQISVKVCSGWLSHLANPDRMHGSIFQWKAIFDQVKTGSAVTQEALRQMACTYATRGQWETVPTEWRGGNEFHDFFAKVPQSNDAQHDVLFDPIPITFNVRYPYQHVPAMQILAESAEYLAAEAGRLGSERQRTSYT